jgi:hypothetical protein
MLPPTLETQIEVFTQGMLIIIGYECRCVTVGGDYDNRDDDCDCYCDSSL